MKDYERLTDRTEENFCDAWYCSNGDCDECDAKKNFNRLAELEDKIESGEICEREEVRKETAREIAEMLKSAKGVIKVHFEAYNELIENIAKKYGVKLEDEE